MRILPQKEPLQRKLFQVKKKGPREEGTAYAIIVARHRISSQGNRGQCGLYSVCISRQGRRICTNNSIIRITAINIKARLVLVLLDTGSPISFICSRTFAKFFSTNDLLKLEGKTYKAINDEPMQIIGTVPTVIELESLPDLQTKIVFHVLQGNSFVN